MRPDDPAAVRARLDLLVMRASIRAIQAERERLAALAPRRRRTAADLRRVAKAKRGAAARHGRRIDVDEEEEP